MILKQRLTFYIYISILSFFLIYVYNNDIINFYGYLGYNPISSNFQNWLLIPFFLFIVIIHFPLNISRPSDFFKLFYLIIVLFSNALFSSGFDDISFLQTILLFFLLYIPILILDISKKYTYKIDYIKLFSEKNILIQVVVFSIFIGLIIFQNSKGFGSFDFISSYDRRFLARGIFPDGSLMAYLSSALFNSLIPFLAFFSAYKKNFLLLFVTLFFMVMSYWSVGLKSLFVYVFVFYFLGYLVRKDRVNSIPRFLILGLILILIISFFEYIFFDFSYTSQFLVRRIFIVAAHLQTLYHNAIINLDLYNFLTGIDITSQYSDVTYFIGTDYLNNEMINANTNTYLYYFLKLGFIGYLLNIIFITSFYISLDSLYKRSKNPIIIFVSCLFAILICEKSFTASLISSGLFLFVILTVFSKKFRI